MKWLSSRTRPVIPDTISLSASFQGGVIVAWVNPRPALIIFADDPSVGTAHSCGHVAVAGRPLLWQAEIGGGPGGDRATAAHAVA